MKVSVIISTYNKPEWLQKVLWGYECQTFKNFEVIIADDGSGEPTRELIEKFKQGSALELAHVWQEDDGFQKSRILNKAIITSSTDYLIFTDGDCVPRNDFVETHVKNAEPGYFLSGGYFKLPLEISKAIEQSDIINGNAFSATWLHQHGLKRTYKVLKLKSRGFAAKLLNFFTPTKATWNGHSSSGWKKDIVAVNGFNEDMQYGGQDRELGERLVNYGLIGKQVRYSAICIHLDHNRGYNTKESIQKNKAIRQETVRTEKMWTEHGIKKG